MWVEYCLKNFNVFYYTTFRMLSSSLLPHSSIVEQMFWQIFRNSLNNSQLRLITFYKFQAFRCYVCSFYRILCNLSFKVVTTISPFILFYVVFIRFVSCQLLFWWKLHLTARILAIYLQIRADVLFRSGIKPNVCQAFYKMHSLYTPEFSLPLNNPSFPCIHQNWWKKIRSTKNPNAFLKQWHDIITARW